jgi:hypothetical protein
MKTLIIQTSPLHTASTFLVNAIYGIIPELFDKRIIFNEASNSNINESFFGNIIAFKSHNLNIDEMINKYQKKYKLFFICSERRERNYRMDNKYKSYNNVVMFDFNELNETVDNPLSQIVDNIYNKLKNVLVDVDLDKSKCMGRLIGMNKKYEEIKHKSFDYVDDFYELHGSHRNRNFR